MSNINQDLIKVQNNSYSQEMSDNQVNSEQVAPIKLRKDETSKY